MLPAVMRPLLLLLVVAAPWPCGCYAAPELGAPKSPVHSLQRTLSPDFSTSSAAARSHSVSRALAHFAAEPARAGAIPGTAGEVVGAESARVGSLPGSAANLARTEVQRPVGEGVANVIEGAPDQAARRLQHAMHRAPEVLGADRRPLGEIDDYRHRTDPNDLEPEATFWQRIRRRLRL